MTANVTHKVFALVLFCGCVLQSLADQWDATRFEYDPETGRLMRKIYPGGKTIEFTWHSEGLPKRITQASGKWMERFYDDRLNAVSNVYSSVDTPDVCIVPNEFGTPLRVSDAAGLVYEYDILPSGQIMTNETVTSPWMNWTLGHLHDQYLRETGWSLSIEGLVKGTVAFDYDEDGKTTHMTCENAFGRAIAVCYTNCCGYSCGYSIAAPNNLVFRQEVVRDFYRRELVTRLRNTMAWNVVFDCTYDYDVRRNLIHRDDQINVSSDLYSYYSTGELAEAVISGVPYSAAYDSAGNCLWASMGVVTNYYQYNELNQCLTKIQTGVNAQNHTYDDDGNLVYVDNGNVYGWDCENRLITIETPSGSVTNTYDYEGRLVKQILPGAVRHCVFDRWNLIYEKIALSNGGIVEKQYFWGADRSGTLDNACGVGGLVAVSVDGEFYFPCYGSNSEITAYVNEAGSIVASYVYGPFGEVNIFSGPMVDQFSFRFMTKRYDDFVGLYDFGGRWYSPILRRWINRDPLGEDGGVNLYVFCGNDPVNKYDPNGCIPLDTVWDLGNIVYDICVGDNLGLATDTAALMIPDVPAGASKLVKAARLSNVRKICPGVRKAKVTYEYLPTALYKNRHTLPPSAAKNWIRQTMHGPAKFNPGWGDAEIKGLIGEAFESAKRQGKFKPADLDGFVYDAGRTVGAANGIITTKIKIHVGRDGKNLHAFPWP